MADIAGNPTVLNVPAPQDANGTLVPKLGDQATLARVTPPPSLPVGVDVGVTYPKLLDVTPPPAVPDMPYDSRLPLVSITVTPANGSVREGRTLQFTATGTFESGPPQDITASVKWSSSDNTFASFSPNGAGGGLATGNLIGDVVVTATLNGVSGTTGLSVTGA